MIADPAETPTVGTLKEGLYVRLAVDNMAWVDMGDHVIVIDALEQKSLETEVLNEIRHTEGDKPVRFVINTHIHGDHTALNHAFERHYGAEIINATTVTIPDSGMAFDGTRRNLQVFHMPGCHSDSDLIVWSEKDSVLFVGDIFGWGLIPPNGDLYPDVARRLLDVYARLLEFEAAVVVPGHGPLCTSAELARWVEYFRWLTYAVAIFCKQGKSDAQILSEIAPPEDMHSWWRFLKWKHEDSVKKVLNAVRGGWGGFGS